MMKAEVDSSILSGGTTLQVGAIRKADICRRNRRCRLVKKAILRSFDSIASWSIEHDPEKWIPVFQKDHAPPNI
jgi:hypothetical protein